MTILHHFKDKTLVNLTTLSDFKKALQRKQNIRLSEEYPAKNNHTAIFKARNRLTNTRVEKLVAIRANLRLFEPDKVPSSTRL
jgi:hypothetical protein